MRKVSVDLKYKADFSYPIYIGNDVLKDKILKVINALSPSQIAVISDTNVVGFYSKKISGMLDGYPYSIITFNAGEASKNLNVFQDLFSNLTMNRFDRKSLIIAIGGGVTGDMAGFLASVYMRGINFIQVPTSLLSMVDSSVGGKTGIDTEEGKNLMGSFYQPKAVIIDVDFIKTLPTSEFSNGMAEVIKHAVILDRSYFDFLKNNKKLIRNQDPETIIEMLYISCRLKSKVVHKDQKESGLRQILNFGHTAGHAIEKASDYEVPHGYAVALGMLIEACISMHKKLLAETDYYLIVNLLKDYGLLEYTGRLEKIAPGALIEAAKMDKKNSQNNIKAVMCTKIGKVHLEKGKYSVSISQDEIINAYKRVINI